MDSLPAACAVRTNGAAIMLADAAADVAMKRRRLSDFFFICASSLGCSAASGQEIHASDETGARTGNPPEP
jgi:hypothetical protein